MILALLGTALALIFVVMSVVWWIALRIKNAGIVDIAWSFNFTPLAILYAVLGDGFPLRRALIAGMVCVWSARLGGYLYRRVMGHHVFHGVGPHPHARWAQGCPEEDGRYQELRAKWAPDTDRKFFEFFQAQGVLNVALSVPFLIACVNPAKPLTLLEWVGAGLWLVAIVGESIADLELDQFRRDPKNKGATCQLGLWRTSRHPNYFFEWLAWVAYFLFALGSPYGWVSLYCPVLMLYFLLRVTGIPMTEAQALKSRGEAYREYQRTTSMFVPWFPKSRKSG